MCLTCEIIKGNISPPGEILLRDKDVVLHHNVDIALPGYLILSPLRHVASYSELIDEELSKISIVLQASVSCLEKIPSVQKVYICSFGEDTSHFHFHVFPRYVEMANLDQCNKIDGAKIFADTREKCKIDDYKKSEEICNIIQFIKTNLKIPNEK